ncbi:lipocalin family protein [Faecalibacter rhinopitheci]|uniref:Lipocalin family protein n=1 Tax=Faecalibacter rhinopitheci TaxID=2779678 RepID=A0A8J7FKR9_9FLAO|nr:lipocalin family protein [Faecalibacter rhinopitheci]MBF0596107.1 lipocalin family protein [Faecalibacter rhinopitheci]MBQ0147033.1 lipocalin family protein [Candidatus Onthonaster equi]
MKFKNMALAGLALGVTTYIIKNRTNKNIAFEAVPNFDIKKYLGLWYEVARLDFYWEKNKSNTTARYLQNEDGSIQVINRGYDLKNKEWKISKGIAQQVKKDFGKLKVSFLGPFYSPYNIIDLDDKYKYALVAGKNTDYLWILSREKSIPDDIKKRFLDKAENLGYEIDKLVWPSHDTI